jgi:hypothetical protein
MYRMSDVCDLLSRAEADGRAGDAANVSPSRRRLWADRGTLLRSALVKNVQHLPPRLHDAIDRFSHLTGDQVLRTDDTSQSLIARAYDYLYAAKHQGA